MRRQSLAWQPGEPTSVDTDLTDRVHTLAAAISGKHVTALTGAGMSTDSGIPDYRSPDAPARTPMTIDMFLSSPDYRRHYWARNHLGWQAMDAAVPNAGHRALTTLQREGRLDGIITQNIDMLHTKAGHRRVLELHGSYARIRCLSCGLTLSRYRLHELLAPLNHGFDDRIRGHGAIEVAPDADVVLSDTADFVMIDCPRCGGILKPDIIYFGESVPKPTVERAYAMVAASDALLVLGSSLTVMSGLRFVRHARKLGAMIAIVNRGRTRADEIADVKIDGSCADVLTALAAI